MFSQVYNSFNRIWGIKENPKSSILKYLSKQALSFSVLLLLFLVIVGSTTLNTFLFKYVNVIQSASGITFIYEHLVSFIVFSVIFAIMYKLLGDAIIRWKPVVITGVFTAILFLIGKIGIGLYIGHSHITSTFGSASVLALIMLWVYYTSQIIFLGASFVKVLSEKMNCEILPNSNAVKAEYKEI